MAFAFSLLTAATLAALVSSLRGGDSALHSKGLLALGIALLPLMALATYRDELRWAAITRPLVLACWIHILIAVWQAMSFGSGTLPLLSLYNNPWFADLKAVEREYSLYVRRPFGLFPEPSAMASSLGPLCLMLLSVPNGGPVKSPMKAVRVVTALATSILVVTSGSVYSVILVAAVSLYLLRAVARKPALALLALPAVSFLALMLLDIDRLSFSQNQSLRIRLQSLSDGVTVWLESPSSTLFGVGPGGSLDALAANGLDSDVIHSVVITQAAEIGLLGVAIWIVLLFRFGVFAHGWRRSTFLLWFAGPLLATGYIGLAGVWVVLALIIEDWGKEEVLEEISARDPDTASWRR